MTTSINLSKIKKKLNPGPDGQGPLRLQSATVSAIASDGTVNITLNGATVTDVPVLGSARFVSGQAVQVLSYRGSLLILGGSGKPSGQPAAATGGSTDTGTTTSGTFVTSLSAGTATAGVAFIAPPSGRVLVLCKSAASNNTAGDYSVMDFQVRQGATINSGTVVRATNENTAGVFQSSTANNQGTIVASDLVTGLTPGAAYNVTMAFRQGNGGTASFNRRQAIVTPQ
jgi:hypothetical protein